MPRVREQRTLTVLPILPAMSQIEDKLRSLGYDLPPPPSAAGNYLPFRRAGNLLFLSGSIAVRAAPWRKATRRRACAR